MFLTQYEMADLFDTLSVWIWYFGVFHMFMNQYEVYDLRWYYDVFHMFIIQYEMLDIFWQFDTMSCFTCFWLNMRCLTCLWLNIVLWSVSRVHDSTWAVWLVYDLKWYNDVFHMFMNQCEMVHVFKTLLLTCLWLYCVSRVHDSKWNICLYMTQCCVYDLSNVYDLILNFDLVHLWLNMRCMTCLWFNMMGFKCSWCNTRCLTCLWLMILWWEITCLWINVRWFTCL